MLQILAIVVPIAAQSNLGIFNITTDTSLVKFEEEDQIYSLTCVADGNFPTILAREIEGDFMMTATFGSVNEYANWEGIGWMVQSPDGFYASLLNSGYNVYVTQQAQRQGRIIASDNDRQFEIMQMQRQGDKLFVRAATSEGPMEPIVEISDLELPPNIRAGIFLGGERLVTAGIWNVRIEKPVTPLYDPSIHGAIPSKVEYVDVLTGCERLCTSLTSRSTKRSGCPEMTDCSFKRGMIGKSSIRRKKRQSLNKWTLESSQLPARISQ